MRQIDATTLKAEFTGNFKNEYTRAEIHALIDLAPTIGGWINNYEWICPVCGSSILVKTSKQSKTIGMKLSVCPVCGKEVLYGKAD